MIEAEYKARLADPEAVRAQLSQRADAETVTYDDTYFDDSDASLTTAGRELRVRAITAADGATQHLLTYKDPAVDDATGSKPELELTVSAADTMAQIMERLGYRPTLSFQKHCENYRFTARDREMTATIVTVPELGDTTFLELETQADEDAFAAALADLRAVLEELGVSDDQLTTELYTEAVERARSEEQS